jgi:diguanylate cyclase (GGDEF)-like protein
MREVLESCVRVDELAEAAYADMQRRCTDPETAEFCGIMAAEEHTHVAWWRELLEAWEEGLLPDVWPASDAAIQELHETIAELECVSADGDGPLDAREVLTRAARIEFFALDPAFAELLELAEPGVARARHQAYDAHVNRLIAALERTFPRDSLQGFLAAVLRRAERENRSLSRYATHDPLTGLGNRRALAAQAQQWASWAARYGSAVSVLLIDVDEFKVVNDAWGHTIGDQVLLAITSAICSSIRSADLVARYGGDEFVLLAPELEPDGATALGNRIVKVVRELKVAAGAGAYVSTTVSVGIATLFDPPNSEQRGLDTILAAADRSLYAAKKAGRDRTGEPVLLIKGEPFV